MLDINSSEKSFAIGWREIHKSVIGRPTLKG